MFRILVIKQMTEVFRAFFYDSKKNQARPRRSTIMMLVAYIMVIVVLIGGMFGGLSLVLCGPFVAVGAGWLYFACMELIAILMGAFGSVFNTFSMLYNAKDNDLLLSMPIPVRTIMASRLASVYILGTIYAALAIVPAIVVYGFVVGFSAWTVISGIVLLLDISLVVFVLSCILGWCVAKISLRMRNKSIGRVAIAVVVFVLYYVLFFGISDSLESVLANAGVVAHQVMGGAHVLYLIGQVGAGDPIALCVATVIAVALTVVTWTVLERGFLKLATSTGAQKKVKKLGKAAGRKNLQRALLGKELKRFTGSSEYMLNCGMGVIFLPVMGICALVFAPMLNQVVAVATAFAPLGLVPLLAVMIPCLASSMICTAVPSISLEGASLWLVKSMPVPSWHVLQAKLRMQLLLIVASLAVAGILVAIALRLDVVETVVLLVACLSFGLLKSVVDMCLGVKMPVLGWTNEQAVIKQSPALGFSIFGSWAVVVAITAVYVLLGWHLGFIAYALLLAVLMLAVSALAYRWLKRQGVQCFEAL